MEKNHYLSKIINFIHLARKAGKVRFGFSSVKKNFSQADIIILAEDLSENNKKKFLDKKTIIIGNKKLFGKEFDRYELGIISISESNIAKKIFELYNKLEEFWD